MNSKYLGATDENDLEVAMVVLRGGTHIEKDEVFVQVFDIPQVPSQLF